MDKKELRKNILKMRDSMDEADRFSADETVLLKLLALKEYRDANTIFTFVSYRSEVDTKQLISESLRRGKRVLVPVVDNDKKEMILSELKSAEEMQTSDMGILEPSGENIRPVEPKIVDICITPGAVFDRRGYRIGYGGGFYDKMMPRFRSDAKKIGVGYDFQLVDEVPKEEHDQKIDMLITDKEIYKF